MVHIVYKVSSDMPMPTHVEGTGEYRKAGLDASKISPYLERENNSLEFEL